MGTRLVLLLLLLRRRNKRRNCLVQEMKLFDHELFFKYFRMLPTKLEELLRWVAPKITKSAVKRDPIRPEERLCVTLRYIVTGDSQVTISGSYRISQATVGRIVKETSDAIRDTLVEKGFLSAPVGKDQWKKVARGFQEEWNFPHCIEAIDGKHVVIQAPANNGSMLFNDKKLFSIVLLAVCNSNYEFIMIDIGESGRQSDGGIFANSNNGHVITNDLCDIPDPCKLEGSTFIAPYVFVADEAFPLRINIIKPYSHNNLSLNEIVANYRICRARRTIENTFGIMAARFCIFRRPIVAKVSTVESITKACVAMHNYLIQGFKLSDVLDPIFIAEMQSWCGIIFEIILHHLTEQSLGKQK